MDMAIMHRELEKDIRHGNGNGNGKTDIGTGIGKWTYGTGQQEDRDNRKWEASGTSSTIQQRISPAREHSFHFGVPNHHDTQSHSFEEEPLLLDRT